MKKNIILSVAVLVAASALSEPIDEVNLFIGTAGTGHTTPAAAYPLGLVQAGPDTGTGDWAHCSGYHYDDTSLHGFTQTHLSGTGCVDLGDVRLLPYAGSLRGMAGMGKLGFDKQSEVATPGYYAVTLKGDIRVEVTASEHAAIYRITYNGTGAHKLLADCQWGLVRETRISREVYASNVRLDGKTGFSGTQLGRHWVRREYAFVVEFDRPYASVKKLNALSRDDAAPRYDFDFDLKQGESLYVKVALSANGIDEARRNLKAEIPAWDFEGVHAAARKAWNDLLSRTTIVGSKEDRTNWYTGLYHLYFQPNNIADVGEKPYYSTFSTWDTFRAAGPLYTILTPEINAEFVDSMLRQGKVTGYLPIWTLWGVDNQCMIGTHSVPMIVDEFLKNGKDAGEKTYWEAAYQQIKATLTEKHERRNKERWDLYDKYGYYPYDEIRGESVSRTVECGYDDWCAAQMAKVLGHQEDAAFFLRRSNYWKNVFDPEIKLLRGKDTKGAWRTPYDPYVCGGGAGSNNDFTEGNSFHYSWHILQDPEGLMVAMGGKDAFVARLDELFTLPISEEMREEETDCTGLIGQYAHGNEPSHHIVYLYTLAGCPEKAADRIRDICRRFYQVRPGGLCGNEDCGQMSAWYLFSAMGFYPLNPCGGEYVIGAPQLQRVEVKVEGEGGIKNFVVIAKNLSEKNKYVKSVTLNGKPIANWKIRHADIMKGGELVFEMAPLPENAPTTVRFTSGGDKYQVAVDCLAAPDLQPWVETKLKPVLSKWIDRLVDDFACEGYQPKTSLVCTLVRELHCPGTSSDEGLKLNAEHIRNHPEDTGMVIHEIWHQLQNYQSECPTYLSEGIDDWVRYYYVEQRPPKVNPKTAKADGGYCNTAAFLEWCGGKPFVSELITVLRQGRYTTDWWKAKTGRTFEELAADWH